VIPLFGSPMQSHIVRHWRVTLCAWGVLGLVVDLFDTRYRVLTFVICFLSIALLSLSYELQRPRRLTLNGTTIFFPLFVTAWTADCFLLHWWNIFFCIFFVIRIYELTLPEHRRALGGDQPRRPRRRRRRSLISQPTGA